MTTSHHSPDGRASAPGSQVAASRQHRLAVIGILCLSGVPSMWAQQNTSASAGTTTATGSTVTTTATTESAVLPPAYTATTTPGASPVSAGGTSFLTNPAAIDELPPLGAPLRWGRTSLQPYVNYRFSTGDGVPALPGQDLKTDIHDLTVGLQLALGDRWMASYTPNWRYYSNDAFEDTVNHSANLRGTASYESWDFTASAGYSRTSDPLIETGRQTDQTAWTSSLGASVGLGSKIGLDFNLTGSSRSGGTFNNSNDWATREWLNYRIVPDLTIGAGVGYGMTNVETGSDMSHTNISGRVAWHPSRKLSFNLDAGWENRKFRDSTRGNRTTPVYSGGLTYTPMPTTSLSLGFSRSVSASYFADQVNDSTGANLSLRQRLLQRYFLTVGYSRRWVSYLGTTEGDPVTRRDNPESWNLGFNTTVLQRANVGLFYNHTKSGSNETAYDRTSTQYGAQIGYRF